MSTYSQITIQLIFVVKGRQCLINPSWEERLYQYITGIIQTKNQKLLAINGMEDHIHILIGMTPSCCLSDLVREIKKSSHNYIRDNKLSPFFFWQEGFGAFSYSKNDRANVIRYIMNQKEHHKKQSTKDEFIAYLKQFQIDYNEKYLF